MYNTISLDPIPEGLLDGNLAMYDIVPLIYLDGNYYPAVLEDLADVVVVDVRSNKAQESYSFKASNDTIYASENSNIGIYYDGNISMFDRVCSILGNLDGNKDLVDNIPLLDFFEDIDKRAIVKLNGNNVNLYDRVQYLPNDVIVVKCDTDGYYEWSSPVANGNFLVKSRFNSFSLNTDSISFGKDHGFVSNYPVSRNYALKSYYDAFKIKGMYGEATVKTSRSRPLDLVASVLQFSPVENILRDLNNEEDQYKISPANMYVKVVGDVVTQVYSASGVLQRINDSIQAVPTSVDLSKYPEVTAPFVFVHPLAKVLDKRYANLPEELIAWPWVTTDGQYVELSRTEQRIKGVIKFNSDYYWCTLLATVDLNRYQIISMSAIKPGFDFEYYRYNFIVMEEHNRSSYVTM